MRSRRPARAGALLASLLSASRVTLSRAEVVLSQFQQINGFSSLCTSAYLTPLVNCQTSDFSPPNVPCSEICFENILNLTQVINQACKGTTASPTTLIGLLFEGKGAQALCPTVLESNNEPPPSESSAAPSAPPPAPPSAPSSAPPSVLPAAVTMNSISMTFFMTPTQGAAPTQTGGSGAAPAQPMTSAASSQSVAVAGTQAPGAAATTGAGSLGGGAVPFTVNNKNSATALAARSPWEACRLGIVSTVSTLLVALWL